MKKGIEKKFLLLVVGLFLIVNSVVSVLGATYYVRQDGSGDFATIQACADAATQGDTCLVYPGSYDERVSFHSSGSDGSPIIFKANENAKVRAFTITNQAYISIDGFEITHEGMTQEASSTIHASIFMDSTSHINILNNYIHDTVRPCISEHQSASTFADYTWIKNNTLRQCGHGTATGIEIFGSHNLVEDNDISNSGGDFMRLTGGDFNVVRNNVWHDNINPDSTYHIDGLQHWCSSSVPVSTHHLLIENNLMYNAPDANSHFTIFQDIGGDCNSSGFILRYNTARDLGSSFAGTDDGNGLKGVDNLIIYSNTLVDLGTAQDPKPWSIVSHSDQAAGGMVLNNIFYNVVRDGGYVHYRDAALSGSWHADYNLGYNSLCEASCIWGNQDYSIKQEPHGLLNEDPLFEDFASHDYALEPDSPAVNAGGPLTTVSAADSGTGRDLDVENAEFFQDSWAGVDPDWIAVGSVSNVMGISSIDYDTNTITLAGSISRNQGDPVYLYKDSDGTRVLYGSAPDIGAYEFVSGTGSVCGNGDCESGETPASCPADCADASSCISDVDSDGDSAVSTGELTDYISSWKLGNVTISDLIAAIGEWKNGC